MTANTLLRIDAYRACALAPSERFFPRGVVGPV